VAYRSTVTKALRRIVKDYKGGKYSKCIRGAVDWGSFDFSTSPFAGGIFVPEFGYESNGIAKALVSLDLFTSASQTEEGIDDEVLDQLFEDGSAIIDLLRDLKDANSDNVVISCEVVNVVEAAAPGEDSAPVGVVFTLELSF